MHPPVHLCFSSPQLRPTSKRTDNASTYSRLRERHTSLHARLLSLSHTNTHTHTANTYTDYSSPNSASVLRDFHVSRFIYFPHFGCSVSSEQFSRCWQSVAPMFTGTSSILFSLCLVSLCFLCHVIFGVLSSKLFKETTPAKGMRLNCARRTRRRGHLQAV